MKFILMILVMVSLVSCGKTGGSSSSNGPQEEQDRDGYLHTDAHEETELLNVTVNEAVSISGGQITFNRPVSVQDTGHRTSCSLSIASGETWQYRETSKGLEFIFPDGSKASLRPVSRTSGITGTWTSVVTKNGMKISRRYAILQDRMIINQDCEL